MDIFMVHGSTKWHCSNYKYFNANSLSSIDSAFRLKNVERRVVSSCHRFTQKNLRVVEKHTLVDFGFNNMDPFDSSRLRDDIKHCSRCCGRRCHSAESDGIFTSIWRACEWKAILSCAFRMQMARCNIWCE